MRTRLCQKEDTTAVLFCYSDSHESDLVSHFGRSSTAFNVSQHLAKTMKPRIRVRVRSGVRLMAALFAAGFAASAARAVSASAISAGIVVDSRCPVETTSLPVKTRTDPPVSMFILR